MNKFDDLIREFKISTKTINLNKLTRETLINIIELYEFVSKKQILSEIENIISNKNNLETIDNLILISKLKSLNSEITQKKYLSKFQNSDYTIYEYGTYFDIYLNRQFEINFLKKDIPDKEYYEVQIFNKKFKKKPILVEFIKENKFEKIEMIIESVIDYLKNNSIFDTKVRLLFKNNEI